MIKRRTVGLRGGQTLGNERCPERQRKHNDRAECSA